MENLKNDVRINSATAIIELEKICFSLFTAASWTDLTDDETQMLKRDHSRLQQIKKSIADLEILHYRKS